MKTKIGRNPVQIGIHLGELIRHLSHVEAAALQHGIDQQIIDNIRAAQDHLESAKNWALLRASHRAPNIGGAP